MYKNCLIYSQIINATMDAYRGWVKMLKDKILEVYNL